MGSSDEIVVSIPVHKTSDASSQPYAITSTPIARHGKTDSQQTSHPSTPNTAIHSGKPAPQIVDLADSSPKSSSSLSDVDEDVLKTIPTSTRPTLTSHDSPLPGKPPASVQPGGTSTSGAPALDLDSSPKAPLLTPPTRKRSPHDDSMQPPTEPPVKRRRGRPPKNAAKENETLSKVASDDSADGIESRIGRNMPRTQSSKKSAIDTSSPRIASRAATRAEAHSSIENEYDGSGRPRRKAAEKPAQKVEYEPLYLYEGCHWVLFDPVKDFPPTLAHPPKFLRAFMHYKPGNDRVLEYNVVSNSIRLKRTPKGLGGRAVSYTESGPRLV